MLIPSRDPVLRLSLGDIRAPRWSTSYTSIVLLFLSPGQCFRLTATSLPGAASDIPGREQLGKQITLARQAIQHLVVPQLRQRADLLGSLLHLVPGAGGGGIGRESAAHRVGAD